MDFTNQLIDEIHSVFDEVDRIKALPRKGLTARQAANEVDRRWMDHHAHKPDPDNYMSSCLGVTHLVAYRERLDYCDVIEVLYRRATRK